MRASNNLSVGPATVTVKPSASTAAIAGKCPEVAQRPSAHVYLPERARHGRSTRYTHAGHRTTDLTGRLAHLFRICSVCVCVCVCGSCVRRSRRVRLLFPVRVSSYGVHRKITRATGATYTRSCRIIITQLRVGVRTQRYATGNATDNATDNATGNATGNGISYKGCPKINARFEFAAICAAKCWQP